MQLTPSSLSLVWVVGSLLVLGCERREQRGTHNQHPLLAKNSERAPVAPSGARPAASDCRPDNAGGAGSFGTAPPELSSITRESVTLDAVSPASVSLEARSTTGPGLAVLETELPAAPRHRVGHHIRLGKHLFMIWGYMPTARMPKGLTISRSGRWLFSSNMGVTNERNIGVYDTQSLERIRQLSVSGTAIELAVSVDDRWLFMTNMENWGTLDVFNLGTFERSRRIKVPGFAKMILPDPSGQRLYVSLWASDGVSRVEWPSGEVQTLHTRGKSRRTGKSKNPRGMALTPDGQTLYVANNGDQSISLVDTTTFTERRRLTVGFAPRHIVPGGDGKLMYVSLTGNDSVGVLNVETEELVKEIAVGIRPKTIQISRDGRFLYVANYTGNSITIVDLSNHTTAELDLDVYKVSGLDVSRDDQFVFVTGFCTNDIWIIQRIEPGARPRLPLGEDRNNWPCFDCYAPFTGCPYPPGMYPPGMSPEPANSAQVGRAVGSAAESTDLPPPSSSGAPILPAAFPALSRDSLQPRAPESIASSAGAPSTPVPVAGNPAGSRTNVALPVQVTPARPNQPPEPASSVWSQ